MTLNKLLKRLKSMPAEAPLVFMTDDGEIGSGYHVTEFKSSKITSIDCGARLSEWTESSLQLLDGDGPAHMKVGKFIGILEQSIKQVDGLGGSPMHVEFAPGNLGMRSYNIVSPESRGSSVSVRMNENRAICKPALDRTSFQKTDGCCSSNAAASACCG